MAVFTFPMLNFITSGPVVTQSAVGLWSGDTGSFNHSGNDINNTAGNKSIYTTSTIAGAGVPVTVDFTWTDGFSTTYIGFFTTAHTWITGTTGGASTTANRSCFFGYHATVGNLQEWDWANTSLGQLANSGDNADVAINPRGTAGQLIRQTNGTCVLKTGGTTRFTTTDQGTGAVHLWIGQSNNSSLNFDNISWTVG